MRILICILCFFCLGNTIIELSWDANPPEDKVTSYCIYEARKVAGPYIKITNVVTTRWTTEVDSIRFWFITASNNAGESYPRDKK